MINKALTFFLLISFMSCAPYIADKDHVIGKNIRINKELAKSDKAVDHIIAPYKAKLDSEMNEVVAITEVDLIKGSPESSLGNWFADVLMAESQIIDERVSFAIQNRGGLRIGSIKKGEITKGKIFELMPFDNFLVIMETTGATLISFLEHIAQDGGWPTSKELKIIMTDKKLQETLVNGEVIDPEGIYFYAVPDYVANGGSDSKMLMGQKSANTGIMIRDVVVNHLRKESLKGKKINTEIDGRFIIRRSK